MYIPVTKCLTVGIKCDLHKFRRPHSLTDTRYRPPLIKHVGPGKARMHFCLFYAKGKTIGIFVFVTSAKRKRIFFNDSESSYREYFKPPDRNRNSRFHSDDQIPLGHVAPFSQSQCALMKLRPIISLHRFGSFLSFGYFR